MTGLAGFLSHIQSRIGGPQVFGLVCTLHLFGSRLFAAGKGEGCHDNAEQHGGNQVDEVALPKMTRICFALGD